MRLLCTLYRTLIEGDSRGGFTIFWADEGLDTGPILLQRECNIDADDTVDTIYQRFMRPEGVKSMGDAVNLVAEGKAPRILQPDEGASYDAFLNKPELCRLNLDQPAKQIHNFIRGLDSTPGAWIILDGAITKLFGSKLWTNAGVPEDFRRVQIEGCTSPGLISTHGLLIPDNDGNFVCVRHLKINGKRMEASEYDKHFLQTTLLRKSSSPNQFKSISFKPTKCLEVLFPAESFSGGSFRGEYNSSTCSIYNPATDGLMGEVHLVNKRGVLVAIEFAKAALEQGDWMEMDIKQRSALLLRLSELLEERKTELAALDALESGVIYRLALEARVPLAIRAWRHSWDVVMRKECPQIGGKLTICRSVRLGICVFLVTSRECSIVEFSQRLAPCVAAGNAVVVVIHKGCMFSSLKLAELSVKAEFPCGVVNILTGNVEQLGQVFMEHPDIRRIDILGPYRLEKPLVPGRIFEQDMTFCLNKSLVNFIQHDCDLDHAVRAVVKSCLIATTISRVYVDGAIFDQATSRMCDELHQRKLGNPLELNATVGCLRDKDELEELDKFCKDLLLNTPAKVLFGGEKSAKDVKSCLFQPTLVNITEVPDVPAVPIRGPVILVSAIPQNTPLKETLKDCERFICNSLVGLFTQNMTSVIECVNLLQQMGPKLVQVNDSPLSSGDSLEEHHFYKYVKNLLISIH